MLQYEIYVCQKNNYCNNDDISSKHLYLYLNWIYAIHLLQWISEWFLNAVAQTNVSILITIMDLSKVTKNLKDSAPKLFLKCPIQ